MDFVTSSSRRGILAGTTAVGTMFGIGMPILAQERSFRMPGKGLPTLYTPTADGMRGPWGMVRAMVIDGELCPFFMQTADKGGMFDFGGRTATIRLGDEASGLTITPEGWTIGKGKGKPTPLAGNLRVLAKAIRSNRAWTKSAMQLRATHATAWPVMIAKQKQPIGKGQAGGLLGVWKDLGGAAKCTTTVITDTVERTVERVVERVRTAQQQYEVCYDTAVHDREGGCGWLGAGPQPSGPAQVCAATYCRGLQFVDIVTDLFTVFETVVEEVTREVVTCTAPVRGRLPDLFDLPDFPQFPELKEPDFIRNIRDGIMSTQDVLRAVALLRQHVDGALARLGPFRCFLEGDWSIAALPLVAGIGIPFGIDICISTACARTLTLDSIAGQAADALGTALSLLATFHSGVATALGIAPIAELAAAASAIGPVGMAAGAAIACLLIATIFHAVMISGQLTVALRFTDVGADGKVCFHHPTLAAALISAVTLGSLSPVLLTPPLLMG